MYLCTIDIITSESDVYHLTPSPSVSCNEDCSRSYECLTLSQFVNNSNHYLTNDTVLIFAPGNHTIESDLYIQSFSMFAESIRLLSKSMIICYHGTRFEFSNVSIVTMTGFEFLECSGSKVVSVGQFILKNSRFYSEIDVYSTVLTIADTIASLDRVTFTCIIAQQPQNHTTQLHITTAVILISDKSAVTITQSWFTRNSGRILYAKYGSVITIFNTTFLRNYLSYQAQQILYFDSGSTVKLLSSRFEHNNIIYYDNTIVGASEASMTITHTLFLDNSVTRVIKVQDCDLNITHSTFMNNKEVVMALNNGLLTRIVHCKFTNNSETIVTLSSSDKVSINHNEFINNRADI